MIILIFLLFSSGSVLAYQKEQLIQTELEKAVSDMSQKIPQGMRIGIDNLQNDTQTNDVTDFLVSTVTSKGYRTFDRRSLDIILEQHGWEIKPYFDHNTVTAMGKIKGVDAILFGSVKEYSDSWGKAKVNVHLQCTYLEGDTTWAFPIVARSRSSALWTILFLGGLGLLALLFLVYLGLKGTGKTKVLNKSIKG